MTSVRLGLWALVAVAQLSVPAWQIVGHERVLRDGRQLKLQTRPVDPADVFRGRYVALSFPLEEVRAELARGEFEAGRVAYLELRESVDGFGEVVALHREKPDAELVLKTTVTYVTAETIRIELPFDRYYMAENAAPEAEAAYRERALDPTESWVTVRISRAGAVLEELYIGAKPVREFLREPQR